jgi:hypothetical protein
MSWAEKITKGIVYGILTGTAFYVVGGIAAPYVAGITPVVTAAIGFAGAFAIAVFPVE